MDVEATQSSTSTERKGGLLATALDRAATVATIMMALVVTVVMIRREFGPPQLPESSLPVPSQLLDVSNAARIGRPDARAVMIEFADYECPFCGQFARDAFPQLKAKYIDPGRLAYVFMHFPLKSHASAFAAAEAAECGRRQGVFAGLHEWLFSHSYSRADEITAHASALGAQEFRFKKCLDGEVVAAVEADFQQGLSLGVSGTPAFLFGTSRSDGRVKVERTLTGMRPLGEFASVIEYVMAKQEK